MLIWPDGPCYDDYRLQMMCFNIYLAFIQYLQFAYQRGVLYRLRSLGERSTDMDITIDGFHSWMFKGSLRVICSGWGISSIDTVQLG